VPPKLNSLLHLKDHPTIVHKPQFHGGETEHDVRKKDVEILGIDIGSIFRVSVEVHQSVEYGFLNISVVRQAFEAQLQGRLLQGGDVEFEQSREVKFVLNLVRTKAFHKI